MTDIVDSVTRSRMMSGIRGKNTKPEMVVRKFLFAAGYRYRLHGWNLAGRPDIVLPGLKAVIFVHGCFWHRHSRCRFAYMPKSNVRFWEQKFSANRDRDRKVRSLLRKAGWRIYVIWECQANQKGLARLLQDLRDCARLEKGIREIAP